MAVSKEEFVYYLPTNKFFWKVTGERWSPSGVKASIGKDGVAWVIKYQGASTYSELKGMLGLQAAQIYKTKDWGEKEERRRWSAPTGEGKQRRRSTL